MPEEIIPRHIRVEASAHCQLSCPSCPTATGAVRPVLGAGHLRFSDFRSLLDRNPSIVEVELSNYGEMFLNPELIRILEYAFESKVVLHADNGVNLNFAREDVLEGLVRYQFRSMTCSIDGASDTTYSNYRVRGNFDRVISNIKKINEHKRRFNTAFPILAWQFVVFGHNQHEIAIARRIAGELGMRFYTKLSWDDQFSPIRDPGLVKIMTGFPYVSRNEFKEAQGIDYMHHICSQLWQAPVLNWDGKLLGCCRNFWGDFGGNAFKEGLVASVNGEKISYARSMLLGRVPDREDIPCTTCDLYHTLRQTGAWLRETDVRAPQNQPILLSIAFVNQSDDVTHVEMSVFPGQELDPSNSRIERIIACILPLQTRSGVVIRLHRSGDYTVCTVPSTRRGPKQAAPNLTFVRVPARPISQEIKIVIGDTKQS